MYILFLNKGVVGPQFGPSWAPVIFTLSNLAPIQKSLDTPAVGYKIRPLITPRQVKYLLKRVCFMYFKFAFMPAVLSENTELSNICATSDQKNEKVDANNQNKALHLCYTW